MRLAALVVVIASLAALHAQTPASPPRDRQGDAKGTAVVRGIVVADDGYQPVRRAEVNLLVRTPSVGPTRPTSQTTTTDAEGRFEFTAVPPGSITLRASKGGYYNQDDASTASGTAPPPRPEPRTVAAGQTLDGQTIRLLRGGAIVGRIVDEFGEPAEGVNVEVLQRVPTADGPRWTSAGRSRFGASATDDTGAFRVWSLPPGRYVVAAHTGRFQVMSRMEIGPLRQGFAPTYFPGTPRLADAGLVTVSAGRDTSGITFALATAPLATVRGTVLSIDQRPGRLSLSVSRIDADRLDRSSTGSEVNSDGSFEVAGLTPGRYRLGASERMPGADRWGPGGLLRAFGAIEVQVDGSDVDGVSITLRPGSALTGRLIADGGGPPPATAAIQVTLVPFDRDLFVMAPSSVSPAVVGADGSFRFDGVFGKHFLRAFSTARPTPPSPGTTIAASSDPTPAPATTWFMTAVTLDGRDVIDVPLEFDGRPADVAVTVTTRPAVVAGTVTWTPQATATPPTVVVFVDDPTRWHREARFDPLGGRRCRWSIPHPRPAGRRSLPGRGGRRPGAD